MATVNVLGESNCMGECNVNGVCYGSYAGVISRLWVDEFSPFPCARVNLCCGGSTEVFEFEFLFLLSWRHAMVYAHIS